MVMNNHPRCEKPADCRIYRQGERLCLQCQGVIPHKSEAQRKFYHKTVRMFGRTQAKRLSIEGESG